MYSPAGNADTLPCPTIPKDGVSSIKEISMNQHFTLFGLPETFQIDENALETRYRALAANCHPDKFASASAFEQKQAVMMAAAVNEAYRILKNPIDRAASLLMTQNIDADAPEHTAFAPEFLMQQMEWRETLAEARAAGDTAALNALERQVSAEQTALYGQLAAAFDAQQYQTAAQLVRQGRFLNKMRQEIENAV